MPTLLIQQIRLQWYKDCRGGNATARLSGGKLRCAKEPVSQSNASAEGREAFFATDGSGQSMIVLFAPEGCVINGVDSELYDWEKNSPESKT